MAHGGSRPGAGRKMGGKNSTPAKDVKSKSVCLPANYWHKLEEVAEGEDMTATKLAARIISAWLDAR